MKIYHTNLSESFELYQDQANEYRWRIKGRNGRIIAASSEGFIHRESAIANFRLMVNIAKELEGKIQ